MADISEYIDAIQAATLGNQIRIPISDAFTEIHKNGKSVLTLNGKPDTYFAKQMDMASLLPMDTTPMRRSPRPVISGGIWNVIGDVSEYKMAHPDGTENPSEKGWYEISTLIEYLAIANPGSNVNPSAKGWYELVEGNYILTSDTKTKTETFSEVTPEEGDNPLEKGWYELVDETNQTYSTTSDTIVVEGKVYYELIITAKTYYEKVSSVGCLYVLTEDPSVVANKTYYEKHINIDWRDDEPWPT